MNISDNTINIVLGEAGLNESERRVYLAGTDATYASADLLKKTGMPRPTLMAALQSLRSFGLCEVQRRDGRSMNYTMLPVSNLKAYLGQQVRSMDSLMNKLDAFDSRTPSELYIQTSDSQDSVQDFLERALRCKSRRWQIIAPRDNALTHLPSDYLSYFKRTRKERQIQSETIWESATSSKQISMYDLLMRKPRYIPESIKQDIVSTMLAFDDSILIIDGTTQPNAVLITAPSVSATFSLMFDMAWRYAKDN